MIVRLVPDRAFNSSQNAETDSQSYDTPYDRSKIRVYLKIPCA